MNCNFNQTLHSLKRRVVVGEGRGGPMERLIMKTMFHLTWGHCDRNVGYSYIDHSSTTKHMHTQNILELK